MFHHVEACLPVKWKLELEGKRSTVSAAYYEVHVLFLSAVL